MTDAFPDKMKAAREILIGLNATDEQMSALADVFDFGADTIEALRAENARLKEALKPFAELAEYYDVEPDDQPAWDNDFQPAIGELRAAAAALKETGDD